jgi:hypothetical protein
MAGRSMWVLWWIEWHWDRFVSEDFGLSTSGFRIPVEAEGISRLQTPREYYSLLTDYATPARAGMFLTSVPVFFTGR